jgi:hypothetical protein
MFLYKTVAIDTPGGNLKDKEQSPANNFKTKHNKSKNFRCTTSSEQSELIKIFTFIMFLYDYITLKPPQNT